MGPTVARPLQHPRAGGETGLIDLDALAAVPGTQLEPAIGEAALRMNQLPLLVGSTVARPLQQAGTWGEVAVVHFETVAAVPYSNGRRTPHDFRTGWRRQRHRCRHDDGHRHHGLQEPAGQPALTSLWRR